MTGCVFLIGAGPGDPGLLTLRGADLLRQADVVLFDGLSNPELLEHAETAEHICVGKHGRSRIWKQEEIIREMLLHAQSGKVVARLKGGDPAVFARTAEEVAALQQAGVPFEVVPGITAALAAGSFAGIPITHRGLASAVALITGHEEPGKSKTALDWEAIARFPGTLVIYMGVTTAGSWTNALLSAGKPSDTPAAIIRRCSLPDQQVIRCTLDEVAGHLTPASKFRPPVIVILGPVTELADSIHWVRSRPLLGQTILVTRPAQQAEALAAPLRRLGARVLVQPVIEIRPPSDWAQIDETINSIADHDFIVFCSHNGVQYFLDRLLTLRKDIRCLAGARLAVVGRKTAETLSRYHLQADIIPDDFRAESLAKSLATVVRDRRVLIIRASRGDDLLCDELQRAGADVRQRIAYQHHDVSVADPAIVESMQAGQIDWVTLMSSASVDSAVRLFGDALKESKLATLSPVTSARVTQHGLRTSAEANPYTVEALIESIQKALS